MTKKAITVTGEISADKLGYVLPHEHIFCDLRPLVDRQDTPEFDQPVTLQNHGLLTRNPYAVLDNAVIDEFDIQTAEVMEFAKAGGCTIADATTECFGRDPMKLRRISELTGVNIVMGCGYYLGAVHPGYVASLDAAELTKRMVREIEVGIDGVRAGMIGEIGTSKVISDEEYKVLKAASHAQAETGLGMHIHACLFNHSGYDAAKFAIENGADPAKICVNHADAVLDSEYIDKLLSLGVYVEFDNFGKEFYVDRRFKSLLEKGFVYDRERVVMIRELIGRGYAKQLMITNDICLKTLTHHYGGWGYDHILTNIVPMMEDHGISHDDIECIVRYNPMEFLQV